MRFKMALAMVAAISMVAAACGSDDSSTGTTEAPATTAAPQTTAGGDTTAPAEVPDLGSLTVVIGTNKTFPFLPAELGLQLGVWEKRGLTVENLYVQGSGQVAQTLAAREGDIAITAGASGVTPIANGLEARVIGEIVREFNMMVMVTGKDSDITDIAGLRNKTVGITSQGSLTDYLARVVLKDQAWNEGDMNIAPIGGLNEQLAALESGAIDAFVWSGEAGFQLEEQGAGRVLFNFGGLVKDNVFEVIQATTAAIDTKTDAVRAYLEGWYEAVIYMKENKAETVAFCMTQYELSEYVCESSYDIEIDNFSTDGTIPDANLRGLAESVVSAAIATAPPVESFFDGRFLPIQL
jgi:ABC-type nitrate/sulfonate/bicarbonate transport system substrate-binding protein